MLDINSFQDQQYHDHQQTLVDDKETFKCDGCGEEHEELTKTAFHDMHDGKKMWYCDECIKIYQEENL